MTSVGESSGGPGVPAPLTVSNRPTVVDLAFGTPRIWVPGVGLRDPDCDVRPLLQGVDEMSVLLDGRRHHLRQAWQKTFGDMGIGGPETGDRPVLVGHPSTWGPRRASSLADAAGPGSSVTLLPRAVLIARSHADVTVRRCAVVETTHLPARPVDPAHPRPVPWDVQIVSRRPDGWVIERCGVIRAPAPEAGLALIDDSVEAVFVDGDDAGEVASAIDLVAAHAVAGRVVAVDRALVVRLGHRTGVAELGPGVGQPAADVDSHDAPGWRSRPLLAGAALVAVLVVAGAFAVGWWQRDGTASSSVADVQVGRAQLAVPGGWRHSGQDTPSGTVDDPDTSRAVFVDESDGRRIIVVLTEVRAGSTRESVATSLRNRIDQRGDDVVTEFSADTRFAGRDVIGYREAPASGSAIRWYVIVDDGLQVSIGCQAGSAAESVDAECEQAVRSARVGPR
ncbi:type VII secretion-associated protein [Gordonia terrae]|uniref:type VII secretion-associated protein n=1 Tax=Gordonia terrae TaxID=2055 RepID=UPI003F6D53F3